MDATMENTHRVIVRRFIDANTECQRRLADHKEWLDTRERDLQSERQSNMDVLNSQMLSEMEIMSVKSRQLQDRATAVMANVNNIMSKIRVNTTKISLFYPVTNRNIYNEMNIINADDVESIQKQMNFLKTKMTDEEIKISSLVYILVQYRTVKNIIIDNVWVFIILGFILFIFIKRCS